MKKLFIFVSILYPFICLTQQKHDIGFIYNTFNLNRINIDYRQSINEKYKLKIGVVLGQEGNSPYQKKDVVFGSDSLITYRYNVKNATQVSLKIGGERVLKQSIFSIGADVLLSYRDEKNYINYSDYVYDDSLNTWIDNSVFNPNVVGNVNPNNSKVRRGYFVPQLQFSFLMDIPIVERLYLNLYVGGLFSLPIYINESEKYDPLNQLTTPTSLTTFYMTSQAGLGIRYAF